jgi:hypothetical protein
LSVRSKEFGVLGKGDAYLISKKVMKFAGGLIYLDGRSWMMSALGFNKYEREGSGMRYNTP